MKKKNILSYIGSMQQLAYVRPLTFNEGRSAGLSAYNVKNGDIQFVAMADKCLDIADFSYKGISINFLSKPGLTGRNHYDTNGNEALRSIMGGLVFTCGLENICAPCTDEGKDYPMHGRMRSTPAEHLSADACWEKDDYVITISGEMRESELFGENLVLRRKVKTIYGEKIVTIQDEIINEAFRDEPMMLMYHFNIGYPLLSPQSELIIPSVEVKPRDEVSSIEIDKWSLVESPEPNKSESVFIHELAADKSGQTFAAIWNKEINIGIKLSFNKKNLPFFYQWKSMASGDYVMGLEPANSSVYGRLYHVEQNNLKMLKSQQNEKIEVVIELIDDEIEINKLKKFAKKLCEENRK